MNKYSDNPYKTLGVSQNADSEEITRVYRLLCKRFHPNANINNPKNDESDERYVMIQSAYEEIVKEKSDGFFHAEYGNVFYGFSDSLSRVSCDEDTFKHLKAVSGNIHNRFYDEALKLLEIMDDRPAAWYYLKSHASLGLKKYRSAIDNASVAYSMDSKNFEYMQYLKLLQNGNFNDLMEDALIPVSSGTSVIPMGILIGGIFVFIIVYRLFF